MLGVTAKLKGEEIEEGYAMMAVKRLAGSFSHHGGGVARWAKTYI
jgi:hypothetical protein